MVLDRWLSPRTLALGSVSLIASCTALGLTASRTASSSAAASPVVSPKPLAAPLAASNARPASSVEKTPCRDDMVLVERTCVDRYEAHLLERQPGGTLTPYPPHERPRKGHYVAASSKGSKPQAFISQREAASACEHAGKRLCKLTEWYRACTGSERTTYPYGATYEPKRCNVGKNHLLSMLHGASSRNWSYAAFNDPKLATTPGFLARSGEYDGCASPEGVHDMVGNLHEWVADLVDRTLPSKLPVPAIIERRIGRNAGNGIFMGGFFSTTNEHGSGCTFTTAAHEPRYHDYSTGFRCCSDATPADP
jgi:formylglycine-generating enzyme required for sulfatase activity